MSDPYPSVISQEGSASRNVQPISAALSSLLPTPPSSSNHQGKGARVLEIGSGSYDHLRSLGNTFPHVRWTGTVRDTGELADVQRRLDLDPLEPNIDPPGILDIASDPDWAELASAVQDEGGGPFDGVLMINILHCIPPSLPSKIFQHLSHLTVGGSALLDPSKGWIAAYGPFLTDGGSYASPADAEFDATHVRAVSPLLGLRSIASIDQIARKWGFGPGHREIMPKGNMWVVWRPLPHISGEGEGEKQEDEEGQERDA